MNSEDMKIYGTELKDKGKFAEKWRDFLTLCITFNKDMSATDIDNPTVDAGLRLACS